MTQRVVVYGFGSFFAGADRPNDIDLLLVHGSTHSDSCRFAIACKASIASALPHADIVMLSRLEADHAHFLARSNAVELAVISDGDVAEQVATLVVTVRASMPRPIPATLKFGATDLP